MNKEHNTNPLDFIRTLARIKLTKDARARMRVVLAAYADMHVLPAHVPQHRSIPNLLWVFKKRGTYASFAALVLIVATGTQATLASEKTVPGDILYPVKVSVAEPVALALSTSGEEKAELATKFASRRVKEASELSMKGKLDVKTAVELAARFDTHVNVISKEAASIEAKGSVSEALVVRTDLEKNLSESAAAFTQPTSEDEEAPSENDDTSTIFTAHIHAKTRVLAKEREELASALAVQVASTTAIAAIQDADDDDGKATASLLMLPEDEDSATSTPATSTEPEALQERTFRNFFFKGTSGSGWSKDASSRYPN